MWNVPNVIVQLFRHFFRLGRNILAITKLPSDHTRSRRLVAKSIGDSSEPVGLVFWQQSDKIVSLTLFLKSHGNYFCTEFRLLSNFEYYLLAERIIWQRGTCRDFIVLFTSLFLKKSIFLEKFWNNLKLVHLSKKFNWCFWNRERFKFRWAGSKRSPLKCCYKFSFQK